MQTFFCSVMLIVPQQLLQINLVKHATWGTKTMGWDAFKNKASALPS